MPRCGEGGPVGALAVEVDGQDGADRLACGAIEDGFDGCWVEVEGGGIDVGQDRSGSGAEDGS